MRKMDIIIATLNTTAQKSTMLYKLQISSILIYVEDWRFSIDFCMRELIFIC